MFKYLLLLCGIIFSTTYSQTQPVVGIRQNTPAVHALTNLTIITSPGKKNTNATLVVRDGIIENVGEKITIPADARIWDCTGLTAYPGLIDLYTTYGQPQPQKEPVPKKPSGTPYWNPTIQAEKSAAEFFTPEKETAKKFLSIGFTTVVSVPITGIMKGTSAVINLSDENSNKQILKSNIAQNVVLNKENLGEGSPTSLMGTIALIRQTLLDAQWLSNAKKIYAKNPAQPRPENNETLESLENVITRKQQIIFETNDEQNFLRAAKIAKEFSLNPIIVGSGYEYRRINEIKETNIPIILPINFPDAPNVSTTADALNVEYSTLRHWDFASENPARLKNNGIKFSLTTAQLKDIAKFPIMVRTAIESGLSFDDALAALTTIPASMLGMENQIGTIEKGKLANFVLTDGELFAEKTKVRETWVDGKRNEIFSLPTDIRGTWKYSFTISPTQKDTGTFFVEGERNLPSITIARGSIKVKSNLTIEKKSFQVSFDGDSLGYKGIVRFSGMMEKEILSGFGELSDGKNFSWQATFATPFTSKPDTAKATSISSSFPIQYPELPFGKTTLPEQPENVLIKNGYVWTSASEGNLENTDLLITKGKITKIAKNISAPKNAIIIDAAGKHITPGLIDCHSHTAVSDGVNEVNQAITAEVRIGDVIDANDINIYRELAGGLTTANVLHGSANAIGGQNQVIKLRWGMTPEKMKFDNAPQGIKFALGENPKQSNWGDNYRTRYPQTRMGVEQIIRDEFRAALDYEKKMNAAKNTPLLIPPRKDLELDAIVEILRGKRLVHSHCYRQDEILMLLRVAEEYGFKIATLQHVLEGYKVAEAIAKHGAGASCFTDWWAFKYEVIDAIPYAGALMHNAGVLVSFNSDSDEMARRMNTEAAKAVKYGGVSEIEALKFVTLNPAKQLQIDKYVGSLEVGKDADIVIWSGHPLSTLSSCEQTWIDGRKYFDKEEDKRMNEQIQKERAELVQKILKSKKKGSGSGSAEQKKTGYSCHEE